MTTSVSSIITLRQTTYWEFLRPGGASRVHFLGKKEFRVAEDEVPSVDFLSEHPLLIDYLEPHSSIYLAGASSNPDAILAEIHQAVLVATSGWRDAKAYLNVAATNAVLTNGYGKLFGGPGTLGKLVSAVLLKAHVAHTALPERDVQGPMRVLVAGGNWVVAKDFRVEEPPSDTSIERTRGR